MWAIYKKEIRQFFNALIAYLVIGVFLTGIGLLTWVFPDTSVLNYGYADLETLFGLGPFVLMFLIPAVTMRMFAEEKKAGTLELLFTKPISDWQIILGKYWAALTIVFVAIIPTLIYAYALSALGNPVGNLDIPGIAGSYIGLLLIASVFVAIGLLASSLSENQIVSFVLAVFLCFLMFAGLFSASGLFSGQWTLYVKELSLSYHYEAMSRGLIDTRNLSYLISTSVFMLILTQLKLGARLFSYRKLKDKILMRSVLLLLVLFALNVLSANVYSRIDFMADKRFTLKPATKEMLANLDKPLSIEILLSGDLPVQYQRLTQALDQTIRDFDAQSPSAITSFKTDPSDAPTTEERNRNYEYLMNQNLSPVRAFYTENGSQSNKLIFPYIILKYDQRAAAVSVFEGKTGISPDEVINQAVENLEFALAVGIQRLARLDRKKVGILQGHGDLGSLDIAGFKVDMVQYFDLFELPLDDNRLNEMDALVISKPKSAFSREDKFKLDQYIMNGGRVLFMLDALTEDMSLAGGQGTLALPIDHKLDDLLFRYGVRLEKNLLQDIQNFGRYPVVIDNENNVINLPWPFYASINQFTDHPVTRNLDAVYARTFGTIDTVKAIGVDKTPLMFTSDYTRVIAAPARVAFEDYANQPDPGQFNHGAEPIAYLLEGKFTSLFKNRLLQGDDQGNFREVSEDTKIVVISDGDLIRNERDLRTGSPLELGINPFADQGEKIRYANKDFLFNALAYLTDANGLITARAKEITLRPLNRIKVQKERTYWQLINLVGPLVILGLFGFLRTYLRKRKYAS